MSKKCKLIVILVLCLLVSLPVLANEKCKAVYGTGSHTFSLATGSPGELGMLKALTDVFNSKYETSMCWRKAGSLRARARSSSLSKMLIAKASKVNEERSRENLSLRYRCRLNLTDRLRAVSVGPISTADG